MYPKEIKDFIEENLHCSIPEISLKLSKKDNWPKEVIINQINGRQKAKQKFPFLENHPDFQFSSPRVFSQASSEQTASYKASLINAETIADLSGGMGIDSYFFSKVAKEVTYVEVDKEVFRKATDNFKTLDADNITTYNSTAEDFIKEAKQFDLIYLDPDRRKKDKRLFLLEDCQPNILELLPLLFEHTNQVLVKLSPIIEIKSLSKQFDTIETIWVVAVKNDCKEILVQLGKQRQENFKINCININDTQVDSFTFDYSMERESEISYSNPLKYLYEPNVAIYKAGAFKNLAQQFNLKKIATNTHLYTSNQLIDNFPGRSLEVLRVEKPNKQKDIAASIVSKNFPQSADEIRNKYKISESKDNFLYACRLQDKKKVFIHAKRIYHFQ